MNEEFLAKQETDLYWFIGVAVIIITISLIGYFTSKNFPPEKKKIHNKKFMLVNLSIFTIYAFLSTPYVGFFNNFSRKTEDPKELNSQEEVVRYIKDYHYRIETLEDELEEARMESRMLRDHYKNLLSLIMIFVLSYTGSQIFSSKKHENSEEN